jgi:hypothetical protein
LSFWGENGEVFDARCRLDGEVVKQGMKIVFPCHTAVVGRALDPVSNSAMEMNRTGNWWLYTSPAGGGGVSDATGSLIRLEEGDGDKPVGPASPGPVSDTEKGVSSLIHSETLVRSERREVAAEAAIPSVPQKSYKEVLLTPAKEVVEPRAKNKKKNRRKMANHGFPGAMDDQNRREDRREERYWDYRRGSGIGGGHLEELIR